MSRNGSGIYNLPTGNPVVTGTTITSNWGNTTMSDIATALTGSVAADGQTPITGNLQMGNNKITGMAAGTASTDAATFGQLSAFVPSGFIGMWSGSVASIPTGWLICDGSNGTPDLRSRFVVGAGSTYAVNATGGSADAVVVTHNHGGATGGQSNTHTHDVALPNASGGNFQSGSGFQFQNSTTSTNNQDHTHSIANDGVSGTNKNLPPYLALAYIMKA